MRTALRLAGFSLLLTTGLAPAAPPDQEKIDAAVRKGAEFLRQRHKNPPPAGPAGDDAVARSALAGLALLGAKVPTNDPAVRNITAVVRDGAYGETRTYHLALALLYLDRLGDPADLPLIQLMGVRLVAGQGAHGGWTYTCVEPVPPADQRRLRVTLAPNPATDRSPPEESPGAAAVVRLHPEIVGYSRTMIPTARLATGDNSNTQFALLAVWAARKSGVPVEASLDAVEACCLAGQDPTTARWGYDLGGGSGTPSMTCVGLLGLATGLARRGERYVKPGAAGDDSRPKSSAPVPPRPGAAAADTKPAPPPRQRWTRQDRAIGRGIWALANCIENGEHAADLYYLWSLERVGVMYGLDRIGKWDWYTFGARYLLRAQERNGAWRGGTKPGEDSWAYDTGLATSFALLFLTRSNVTPDLAEKVRQDPDWSARVEKTREGTELRAATTEDEPAPVAPKLAPRPAPPDAPRPAGRPAATPPPNRSPPADDQAAKLTEELLAAVTADATKALERARDGKGGEYTRALVAAIPRLDGDLKKQARDALAERLTRMSADTLTQMLGSPDAELRRAAVLACAMKDDRSHVPGLIGRLTDDDEMVVRAARAGLKSLSGGRDFGPAPGAAVEDRQIAADAWRAWWAAQK